MLQTSLSREHRGAILGGGSIWFPKTHTGIIDPSASWRGLPMTGASLSRAVLVPALEAIKRKRVGWNKRTLPLLYTPHPLYCTPASGEFLVLDIKSCYWSLYKRLWLDMHYDGEHWGRGALPLSMLGQEWGQDKRLRNSLIGVVRARNTRWWDGEKVRIRPSINKLLAPELWGFMAHLLHCFAARAIELGACYYHTDGGIWPRAYTRGAIQWQKELTALGLVVAFQGHGKGQVTSPGNWQVGEDRRGISTRPGGCDNIAPHWKALEIWTAVHRHYEEGRYILDIPIIGDMSMNYQSLLDNQPVDLDLWRGNDLRILALKPVGGPLYLVDTDIGYMQVELSPIDQLQLTTSTCGGVGLKACLLPSCVAVRPMMRSDGDWKLSADGWLWFSPVDVETTED